MPLRKYQIANKAISKDKLAADARIKVETQLLLCRGSGANITGNAGTSYASLPASYNWFHPDYYRDVERIIWVTVWNPETTAGGIELYNGSVPERIAISEPGTVGWKIESFDVTSYFKALTSEIVVDFRTKGDGTTAPTISFSFIRMVVTLT